MTRFVRGYVAHAMRVAALLLAVQATVASAAIDTLQLIVDTTTATGGNSIAAFGYNPLTDEMYVSGFGAGATMRKVSSVSTTPTAQVMVSEAQLQLYYRDGNPDRGVSTPLQSAILLNPLPINDGVSTLPAYSFAMIADNGFTRFPLPLSTTTDPAATKRFYSYNLQAVNAPPGLGEFGDGRDVYTTRTTLAAMQAAIGSTSTIGNQGRQFAWSGDGQSIYFADSSNPTTQFGGLWKLNPITGAVARLAATDDVNTELAVTTSSGVDSIYVRGGVATGNEGGIDKWTHDGVTTSARTVVKSVATLREFLDAGTDQTPTIFSMASDADGNVYFNNTDTSNRRRAIFRLDPQGRLSKVVSYAERDISLTGVLGTAPTPNANTLRMQPRTVTHPTAGSVTQILYAESTPLNTIVGAYAFKPGDFDRDGDLDAADLGLFGGALATRGTVLSNNDHYRFDLNANSVVDWRDVKVVQQFAAFPNGDVDFDGTLELTDLDTLGANYLASGKTWLQGDLASVDPLYATTAVDANVVNQVDVNLFADTWLNVLSLPITESQLTTRGYTGQFLTDVLDAFGFGALPGDFNGDDVVNGGDLLTWQQQLGSAASPAGSGADGDGDGTVDADDLAVWKLHFGDGGTPATAAATSVPEPGTLGLVATVLLAGAARRPRRTTIA